MAARHRTDLAGLFDGDPRVMGCSAAHPRTVLDRMIRTSGSVRDAAISASMNSSNAAFTTPVCAPIFS